MPIFWCRVDPSLLSRTVPCTATLNTNLWFPLHKVPGKMPKSGPGPGMDGYNRTPQRGLIRIPFPIRLSRMCRCCVASESMGSALLSCPPAFLEATGVWTEPSRPRLAMVHPSSPALPSEPGMKHLATRFERWPQEDQKRARRWADSLVLSRWVPRLGSFLVFPPTGL